MYREIEAYLGSFCLICLLILIVVDGYQLLTR